MGSAPPAAPAAPPSALVAPPSAPDSLADDSPAGLHRESQNVRLHDTREFRKICDKDSVADPDPVGSVHNWLSWIQIYISYTDPDPAG